MNDISIGQMLDMQRMLQERYAHKWMPMRPENAHYSLLWAIGEMGEVIDIIKKDGHEAVMRDPAVRARFVEETADVLMYVMDMLLCMDIKPAELAERYRGKAELNMTRWV